MINPQNTDIFTSVNGTFTQVNNNLLLDINNSLYYFEVNSVKNDAFSVCIVAWHK